MDVVEWLRGLGLPQYAELFQINDIDADMLGGLNGDDLKDIGISSLGHRKRLLEAIARLADPGDKPAWSAGKPEPVQRLEEAERRHLTVMFVDLVGSTSMSTKLDPEDMREVIRAYQNAVAGEITRLEGHVAKFMGDGVLAYFGWPRTHEDEAERAVRAGLAIASTMTRLPPQAGQPLQVRIGIATGLVVVGDLIGEGAAQEQAVVGDTPNLAARLQAIAEPGMVVMAERTRRQVGELFVLQDLGMLTLKGIADPVPAYAVVAERSLESRFAARQAGGLAPLVGRDQELALLVERWRQAKASEGQVILLTGEAGIGKSRITESLVTTVAEEAHVLLRYQCSPYHGDSALFPVIQQITQAAGFAADETLDARLDRLESLLSMASDAIGDTAPLIADLIGLDGASRYGPLALTPQQRRGRTLAALIAQLAGLARSRPVLWVVEDAHWIDPTTLELIEQSLDGIQGQRVLLLITARPTFTASFASHPVVTRLALNRLARAATQSIVSRITRGKRLPESLLDEIAAKTDGVPLYVEEMTKAVIESGAMRETAEAYHFDGPLSALAVPATLHDSLMARLDRLHGVKEVAQTAAVIGRSFDHRTLSELAGLPAEDLEDALRRLMEAELIFRRGTPPEAHYLFKHALVRDAAYESMLKAKRVALHHRLLNVKERDGDAAPEVLAQHAEAAGLLERAVDLLERAGTQAIARPAYKEAIASLEHAIRLCRALGTAPQWRRREQRLFLQLGQALLANQGYSAPATLHAFEQALSLADEIGDADLQIPAVFGQWAGHHIAATGSGRYAERFADLVQGRAEVGPHLVALRMLGLERFFEGRFTESLALVDEAIDRYDPVAHADLKLRFGHDPRVAATNYRSWNLWHLGFPDQASQATEDNLRLIREINHPNTTGLALCYGATVTNILLRRPDRVEVLARQAIRLSEEMSLALWHAWGQIHLGWALFQQGVAPGLEEIEAGLEEARLIGAGRLRPLHCALAAHAYAAAGRHPEATASIATAFDALSEGHHFYLTAEVHRMRAGLVLRSGVSQRSAVEGDLRMALDVARRQGALSLELRAARDLASLLADTGERQQAVDLLAPVLAAFTEGFDTPDLRESRTLLDSLSA